MFVPRPIVGVRKVEGWPHLTTLEEDTELSHEGFRAAKELDEAFWVMGGIEPVVPCVPLDVILGEDVEMFPLPEANEGPVGVSGLEESGFVISNILVEHRPPGEFVV